MHLVELHSSRKSHQNLQPPPTAPVHGWGGGVPAARHCSPDTTGHVRDHKWLPLACQAPAPESSVRLKPAVSGRRSCQTAHHYLGSSPHPSLCRLFPARMRCWCCLNKCLVLRRTPSLRLYPASEWVLHLTQPAKWRFKRLGDQLRPVMPTLKIVFKGYCALHFIRIHFLALKCHRVDLALRGKLLPPATKQSSQLWYLRCTSGLVAVRDIFTLLFFPVSCSLHLFFLCLISPQPVPAAMTTPPFRASPTFLRNYQSSL